MKVLLLAPVDVPGGIATWANTYMQETKNQVACVDTARRYMTLGARQPVRRALLGGLASVRRVIKCLVAVRREHPDVVYLTCAPGRGLWFRDFPLLVILGFSRVPAVVHLHGGNLAGLFGRNWAMSLISRFAFNRAAAIITITTQVNARAEELLGKARVRYVPNMLPSDYATDRPANSRDNEQLRVLHVGAQTREKGIFEILQVASLLTDVTFTMVGPIPSDMEPIISERVRTLGISERVVFTGPLRGQDLAKAYAEADIFALPSHDEGFPMVILEAMANGLPLVTTAVGASADIVNPADGKPAGYVVSTVPADVTELFEVLTTLSQSSSLRAALGTNGREMVERRYKAATVVAYLDELVARVGRREPLPQ